MAKTVLKIMNSLVGFVIVLALCLAGAYSVYALWDNGQVYAAAENVQADMLRLKSTPDQKGGASFAELLAINPDVCAWVTLDNTKIDHPVLQGETNLSYINTDVYGSFALAGSIFLDATNNRGFTDAYSLLLRPPHGGWPDVRGLGSFQGREVLRRKRKRHASFA